MSGTHRLYRQFQDIGEFISEIQSLARKIQDGSRQPELFRSTEGKRDRAADEMPLVQFDGGGFRF